jgi:hypothetical protein
MGLGSISIYLYATAWRAEFQERQKVPAADYASQMKSAQKGRGKGCGVFYQFPLSSFLLKMQPLTHDALADLVQADPATNQTHLIHVSNYVLQIRVDSEVHLRDRDEQEKCARAILSYIQRDMNKQPVPYTDMQLGDLLVHCGVFTIIFKFFRDLIPVDKKPWALVGKCRFELNEEPVNSYPYKFIFRISYCK